MSVVHIASGIPVWLTWADFKLRVSGKRMLVQAETITAPDPYYMVIASDSNFHYFTNIYTGTVPTGTTDADGVVLTQVANDANEADFVANYQPTINQRILLPTPEPQTIIGYASSAVTSFVPIRGTPYTEQTTHVARSIVSNNVNDTAAGTGARTVRVTYYDASMAGPFTADLSMNGTSPVNTTNMCFIESMVVQTAGSQGGNVGTISLMSTTAGGGSVVGTIAPGDNQTQWCHHYVPTGKKAQVAGITGAVKGAYGGELHLRKATPTIANTVETTIAPILRLEPSRQGAYAYTDVPLVYPGPARLTLYGRPDNSAAMTWQGGLSLYEVG